MGGQIQLKPIDVREGDQFKLTLRSNPSTGTVWKLKKLDESIVEFIKNEFLDNNPEMVGSPVTEVWEFKALQQGSTTIEMTHEHFGDETGLTEYFKVNVN